MQWDFLGICGALRLESVRSVIAGWNFSGENASANNSGDWHLRCLEPIFFVLSEDTRKKVERTIKWQQGWRKGHVKGTVDTWCCSSTSLFATNIVSILMMGHKLNHFYMACICEAAHLQDGCLHNLCYDFFPDWTPYSIRLDQILWKVNSPTAFC